MHPTPVRPLPVNAEVVKSVLRRKYAALGARSGNPCVRLFAGLADGREGLLIDRYGTLVVVTDYAGESSHAASLPDLVDFLRGLQPDVLALAKIRTGGEGQSAFHVARFPSRQDPALPLVATERGLRFEIGTDPAHDFGVFLDAAKARQYVRHLAKDRNVLNLFAYTAAFGVAAAVGGAFAVTNVDPNRDYLAWARRNAALNGVEFRVLPDTAQVFLRRHLRRMERGARGASPPSRPYDLVIVDPPAFGVGRGQDRIVRKLWPEMLAALRAMKPRDLVILCNDKYFRSRTRFEDVVREGLGREYTFRPLGTCLDVDDVAGPKPVPLDARPTVEDPYFQEPLVLAGTR